MIILPGMTTIINKASPMLGLIKRTCHFVVNSIRKRTLYMTMIRSQFEHCLIKWRPVSETEFQKFESMQRNDIKWILMKAILVTLARKLI